MSQAPPPPAPPYGTPPTQGSLTPGAGGAGGPATGPKAIASLVCGVLSLLTCCLPFVSVFLSVPLGIAAVVLGVMAKGEADRGVAGGRGLALAGIITGAIGALLSIIATVAGYQATGFLERKTQEFEQKMEQQQQKGQRAPSDTDTTDTDTTPDNAPATPPAAPAPNPQ